MARTGRRLVLALVLLVTALGGGVLAHDQKDRDARDERFREPRFRVAGYQLVKVERIDRRVRQFTYRARLRNRGPAVAGATAVLVGRRQDIDVVDGELTFGPIGAGGWAQSQDTFTFRRRGDQGDSGNLGESMRWEVRPFAGNRAPVANAGADQSRAVGARTSFDGSRSTDPDGDALSYHWTLLSRPPASRAALDAAETVRPSLVIDAPGSYVAGLVVDDGHMSSAQDTVVLTTPNQVPVANAGPDATVDLGARAVLSGAASTDPDGDVLSYRWRLSSRPAGSAAVLEAATGVGTAVTPDLPGSYVVQLVVNDGRIDSAVDSVVISTRNSVPVARAGADRSALVGSSVTLDGSASSDADGNPLTFQWTVVSRPAGSVATPVSPTAVTPSIAIDRPGAYRLRLVVHDGTAASAPDDVDISTVNSAPVANAGLDAHVVVGQEVALDGSGSTDVDGDTLTYGWSFASVPAGSAAAFDAAGAVAPHFTVDRAGTYVAQLIVFDGAVASIADTVVITTRNSAPVARAGADQAAVAGAQVLLDGSASSDPDDTPITFAWSFVSVPVGSSAAIANPASPTPVFRADRDGLYVVQLVVSDGVLSSDPDTVSVSTTNTAPVARAGADLLDVPVDGLVPLDGSASSDADGQPITFRWSLLSMPAGSAAALSDDRSVTPTFVADRPGDYVAQLIVDDGLRDSAPDTVLIRTANRPPLAAAGADQSVAVGATVDLDGTASSDADGNVLTAEWSFVGLPDGSAAAIVGTLPGHATFLADVAGDFSVRLTVTDGAGGSATDDLTVHVAAPGHLELPAQLTWAAVQIGGASTKTLLVTNNGGSPVTVTSADASGDFTVDSAAGSCLAGPVAAGGTCDLRVAFTPTAVGTLTGSLSIDSDAPGSPNTVALSGAARAADITAAPATLTFAATQLGQTSGALSGTVTNAGSGDIEIATVTVSGEFALVASASDRCQTGTVLAPGATCAVTATFQPVAGGARTGSVVIEASGVGDLTLVSRAIALQGNGVAPVVSLAVSDGAASEFGNDPGTVTLSRTGSLTAPLTVQYTLTGSATNGVDYALLPGAATFAAGQATATVMVTPISDLLNEGPESVTVALVDGADYDLGAATSGAISIEDAFQQVSIAATDGAASEAGPDTGSLTVSRVGATSRALTVNLAVGGTATAGVDYQPIGSSVVIPVGQASAVVLVTPIPDVLVEGVETVTVTVGAGLYVLGPQTSAAVNIDDDVTPRVSIAALDATASEGGLDSGVFRFTRTGILSTALTAHYTVSGTAINNGSSDFTPLLNGVVVFGAGQATVDLTITPVADGLVEGSETVILTLLDDVLYDLGASTTATVTITDPPPTPIVTMTVLDADAAEAGLDTGAFRFTRTGDLTAPLTVSYFRDGTAVNATDYVNIGGSITFPAGQATVDRLIVPINDGVVEGPETVSLSLVDGASYDLGASNSGIVTIADQPTPIVSVQAVDAAASETGPDSGTFRFTRVGDTAFALTVAFTRTGTAATGDYNAATVGTSVVFPAGQATVDKVVTPVPDAVAEGSETVVVTLTDGPQYHLGSPVAATVVITD